MCSEQAWRPLTLSVQQHFHSTSFPNIHEQGEAWQAAGTPGSAWADLTGQ